MYKYDKITKREHGVDVAAFRVVKVYPDCRKIKITEVYKEDAAIEAVDILNTEANR